MAKPKPRQRKNKHRQQENAGAQQQDTNVVELLPTSKAEKEERRRKLREELRASQPKISAKKQKRLDKYIVRKLSNFSSVEMVLIPSTGEQAEKGRKPRASEETRADESRYLCLPKF